MVSEKPTYEELEQRIQELERAESDRTRAEEARRESESRLREAQQLAHMGNWFWDVNSGKVEWSDEVFKIFRLDPKEFTPQIDSILDLSPWPEDHQRDKELIRKAVESREVGSYEQRFLRPDGSTGYYVSSFQGTFDDDGKLTAISGAVQDITERKRAEDELRQYEHIVSSAKDMLALIDRNYVYLSANAAYIQAFAKTSDQIIGRTLTDVFGEEFFGTVIRPRAERCLAGENIRYQYWFDFPAAGRRYMDIIYSPYLGADGEVGGYVITARDITEYDNLQSQLVQTQKMESVGRLAGGVAHDYNNILSVILGYTELALDKVDQNDPLHADLQEILTAAMRSTDITRQLLAFARKQTVAPKVLDLNETLEAMLKMLRKLIGEDIDLTWHPRANLWPVKMDPSQVDQILVNLCVNARDAIADVGKVTIETDKTTFNAAYCSDHVGFIPGEFVLLAVSDNGCGMDKETLDKLFEPFFTTKELGQGTGLGLATVYGIVKQNDGFINVYSEPGKGTTFKIYLPRHAGEAEEISVEGAAEIPKGRGEIVLVVEDEASILKLANRILDGLGYKVLTAGTPGEALVLAKEHAGKLHLLITDVVMPEMNGRELANRLQALYPDLKTLFMSGYTANVIAHRGVLETGVCFMPKPFSKKALAVKVREALDRGIEY
jgi:two-component system, cell cycle sensor histidine kinase and response regulator CckA